MRITNVFFCSCFPAWRHGISSSRNWFCWQSVKYCARCFYLFQNVTQCDETFNFTFLNLSCMLSKIKDRIRLGCRQAMKWNLIEWKTDLSVHRRLDKWCKIINFYESFWKKFIYYFPNIFIDFSHFHVSFCFQLLAGAPCLAAPKNFQH